MGQWCNNDCTLCKIDRHLKEVSTGDCKCYLKKWIVNLESLKISCTQLKINPKAAVFQRSVMGFPSLKFPLLYNDLRIMDTGLSVH